MEVKGNLARLLATENLVVEHRNVETAMFNVVDRVLTLPMWKRASSDVYDLLVGHEVGHALYTPNIDWAEVAQVPKDYVNVVEDSRIEKLMKRKYPGLSKTFFKGYQELDNQDFFSINDEELDNISFIDRINLHCKIGAFSAMPFSDEERVMVKKVEDCETFDDVISVRREIYDYSQKEKHVDAPANPNSGAAQGTAEQIDSQESKQNSESPSTDGAQSVQQTDSDEGEQVEENAAAGGSAGGDTAATQRAFDENSKIWCKMHLGILILCMLRSLKCILTTLLWTKKCFRSTLMHTMKKILTTVTTIPAYVANKYNEYKKSAQKEVNYLVKEFECKKAADSHARTTTARTGVLDTAKLHTYKYNEDLFRKISVIPDGKNHGMIFILDWSGSMSNYLQDTIKQLLSLVWFCRKVNIPLRFMPSLMSGTVVSLTQMSMTMIRQ